MSLLFSGGIGGKCDVLVLNQGSLPILISLAPIGVPLGLEVVLYIPISLRTVFK